MRTQWGKCISIYKAAVMIKASGNPLPCTKQWTKLLDFYQYLWKNIDNIYCFASKMQHHHSSYKKIWTILQWIAVIVTIPMAKCKNVFVYDFSNIVIYLKRSQKSIILTALMKIQSYSVEIIRIAFESQLNLRFIISLAEYFKSREYIFDVSERLFSWINFCLIFFLNIKKQQKLKTSIFWQFFSATSHDIVIKWCFCIQCCS